MREIHPYFTGPANVSEAIATTITTGMAIIAANTTLVSDTAEAIISYTARIFNKVNQALSRTRGEPALKLSLQDQFMLWSSANREGFTPLMIAACNGDVPIINTFFLTLQPEQRMRLLSQQATLSARYGDRGDTPLVLAIRHNHIPTVKALLAQLNSEQTFLVLRQKITPTDALRSGTILTWCADRANVQLMQALLDNLSEMHQYAILRTANHDGQMPLMLTKNPDVQKLLYHILTTTSKTLFKTQLEIQNVVTPQFQSSKQTANNTDMPKAEQHTHHKKRL